MENKAVVDRHFKPLRVHGMRHIVSTELIAFYGFNLRQLSMFTVWSLKSMTGASPSLARYAHMEWMDNFNDAHEKPSLGPETGFTIYYSYYDEVHVNVLFSMVFLQH